MLENWFLFALGSAFFAALTAIFGKIGVSEINSNLATFFRTIIILLVTAAIISFRSEWQKPETLSSKSIIFLTLSGLATGFSWLCYYRALQLGPVSKAAPVDKLSIVFVFLFAILFLGEKLSFKAAVGAVLVSSGVLLMAL